MCGKGGDGALGFGKDVHIQMELRELIVQDVRFTVLSRSVGEHHGHTLATTSDGLVYSWGDESQLHVDGCARGNESIRDVCAGGNESIRDVCARGYESIIDVCAGGNESIIDVCARGYESIRDVCARGYESIIDGCAGGNESIIDGCAGGNESIIDGCAAGNESIIDVCAGGIHGCMLSKEGHVFTWRCGSDGRLGHLESTGHRYSYRSDVPKRVEGLSKYKAFGLSCSYYHTAACVEKCTSNA